MSNFRVDENRLMFSSGFVNVTFDDVVRRLACKIFKHRLIT